MLVKAELKNYRQSSRKVRLVADLVRGKNVSRAVSELNFLNKKAASVIKKLIDSAVANAKHNFDIEKDNLIIKEIRVDEGKTLKRWRAGARGRAFPLKKRTSRVFLALSENDIVEKTDIVKKTIKNEKKNIIKIKKTEENKVVKKVVKK